MSQASKEPGWSSPGSPTAIGGVMAAIVLVLAVADAALLANVALADTSASSVSVFAQAITGYTQGELLLLAAGLACCCRCCRGLPGVPPAHGAPSVEGCGWHDARWRVGSPSWRGRTHACVRSWRARGAPARWSGRAGRPARPRSKPATLPQRARGPAPTPPSGREPVAENSPSVAPSVAGRTQPGPGRPTTQGVRWAHDAAPAGPCPSA
jgi:hypothetical protein